MPVWIARTTQGDPWGVREMKRKTFALLLAAFLIGIYAIGAVTATHPDKSFTCTYEVGPGSNLEYSYGGNDRNGDVPGTSDGSINYMGCQWEFPDSAPDGADYRVWEGGPQVSGEYASVQTSVVDDVWGAGSVGGIACMDVDVDYVCGDDDKGELGESFCGTSSTFTSETDTDTDGHTDLGGRFLVILSGVAFQSFNCPDDPEKFGISGGVLDSNGGITLTFSN